MNAAAASEYLFGMADTTDLAPGAPGTGPAEGRRDAHIRERQDEMLGAVDVGLWYCDLPFDELMWDRRVKEHFWLPPDARVTIETFYARIHPEDRERTRAAIERSIAARGPYDIAYRTVAPADHPEAGEVRWVRAIGYTGYDAAGQPVRFDGVTVDITGTKRAEQRLTESEARFRALVDATDQYVWTNDADGRMTGDQPGWARLTGQQPAEYAGFGWADAMHPDDRAATLVAWRQAVAARDLFEVEHRVRRRDGAWRRFWVRAIPIREADGAIREWVGIHTDVTERRALEAARDQALAEARHERARLQEVFTQAPSAIGVTEGPEHRIVVANRDFAELVGGRPLVGRTVHEAFPELEGEPFFALLDRVYATGEPYVGSEVPAPLDRDGDGTPEEYLFNFTYQPLREVGGQVTGVLIHAVEVTDQVRARRRVERLAEELDRERARLAELLEQAPAAISMTRGPDHVGVMQNGRSRELAGRSTLGRPLREVFPDLAAQEAFAVLDEVYATGVPAVLNEVLLRWDRDGDGVSEEEGSFNIVYQPTRGEDGRVEGIFSHAVEVTGLVRARQDVERKAAELEALTNALERSNRELDQFAYVASHDLKAPLRGIANLTQWIEEDLGERVTGESREHMRLLQGRVHRMEALIDGILAYSRAGRGQVAPERVDLGALARETAELASPPAGTRIEIAEGMPAVVAERVPLQQVLLNLIGNAVKYTRAARPDPVVRVGWRDLGAWVELSVADNGPGIEAKYHDRIWGIFQTLEARDKVEGTGIGLAVVKKIVESRGGRAWLTSTPGEGTTFYVTIPKVARRAAAGPGD